MKNSTDCFSIRSFVKFMGSSALYSDVSSSSSMVRFPPKSKPLSFSLRDRISFGMLRKFPL